MKNPIDRYKNKLPKTYIDFIATKSGFEGDLGDELGYGVIWSLQQLDALWKGYEVENHLSSFVFPVGSNGGGEMIVINLNTQEVFLILFVGMSDRDAVFLCDSFSKIYNAINEKSRYSGTMHL